MNRRGASCLAVAGGVLLLLTLFLGNQTTLEVAVGGEDGALAASTPLRRRMATKHEGGQTYGRFWNFWARTGSTAQEAGQNFFRDYEANSPAVQRLVRAAGFPGRPARTEGEIWERIRRVWDWWRLKVKVNNAAYAGLSSVRGSWPSLPDYAAYYEREGELVCAACFSKAHLFASLLGRMSFPRDRVAIASAHHTERGAPPTATHVFVAVYVAERWYYLDPTAAPRGPLPSYAERRSVGVPSMRSVDYEHPYKILPVPGSALDRVPWLGEGGAR